MSFRLLFIDEIKGFIKSKAMLAIWIGFPLMTILTHFIQPEAEDMPVSILTGLLIASIGGLLGAVMLSTTIVNELNNNVYDLFLIRPVKRRDIILSKYFAVYLNLLLASIVSFAIGILIDRFTIGLPPQSILIDTTISLVSSIAAMSIACAAGILIGILVKSVALAAILAIYLGEQVSLVALFPAIIPGLLKTNIDSLIFALSVGIGLTILILLGEIYVFKKKQF